MSFKRLELSKKIYPVKTLEPELSGCKLKDSRQDMTPY